MTIMRKKFKKNQSKEFQGVNLAIHDQQFSINAEQYRALRTNIEFTQMNHELSSLLVTSSIPSEGKSTISANLALVLAQTNKKILLVDADLRKPTIHKTFRLNNLFGLSALLQTNDLNFLTSIQGLPEFNLSVLTSGPLPPNPSELLGSPKMTQLVEKLESYFDLVIYDAPPITSVTDAIILSSKVDGVLLVSRYGYTKREDFRKAKRVLKNVEANILGYVMNDFPRPRANKDHTYYGPND